MRSAEQVDERHERRSVFQPVRRFDLERLHERQRSKLVEIELRIRKLMTERHEIEQFLSKRQPDRPRLTIMEAILATLDHKPDGMTATEILAELNEKYFDGELARTSLSPQLSRLKDRDEKIELRGDRWIKLPTQPNLFGTFRRRL